MLLARLTGSRLASLPKRLGQVQHGRGLSSRPDYDAVVVGAGHNGLVAAAYLAKSGRRVCVVERRDVVGGAAVTEEVVPGYKFSRASYLLSLMRPAVIEELELKRQGLHIFRRQPSSFTPIVDSQQSLTLGTDAEENKKEIAKFSEHDAAAFEAYEEQLNQFVDVIDPLLDLSPADLASIFAGTTTLAQRLKRVKEVRGPLRKATKALKEVDLAAMYQMMTTPTEKVLDKIFESEPLKATLATDATIGGMLGPSTPGGGYVLLHHIMGEIDGVRGAWGYPRGGMGAVSQAIASAAKEAGATIVTGKTVKKILVDEGAAKGVQLSSGEEIHSDVVLSNATPKVTFLDLLDGDRMSDELGKEFIEAVNSIDYTSPVTKINAAVNKIPQFTAIPNSPERDSVMPHHRCTIHLNCESTETLEKAYEDAAIRGEISHEPMIEMVIPSSLDDSLAPPGHHVCLFFTQYTPYALKNGKEWNEETKEDYAQRIFDVVERYAPGFKSSLIGHEVLSPPDLENIFGLTGGNIFHGSMALDQLFLTRPVASHGRGGKKHYSPETPLPGLYLCGSGAHPGGGVMGAPGRLAAREVLRKMGVKWRFS